MAWGHEIWDRIHVWEKVWTLVDLPDDRKAIKNKWIFNRKTDADGSVTIYKAWIVAKGFQQVQYVDYDEIFSLIMRLRSVRIMLAIATFYEIWQMEVKPAIVHRWDLQEEDGFLKEELYVMQPEGFVGPKGANKVCKAPAIHLWTGASISELEYTLW